MLVNSSRRRSGGGANPSAYYASVISTNSNNNNSNNNNANVNCDRYSNGNNSRKSLVEHQNSNNINNKIVNDISKRLATAKIDIVRLFEESGNAAVSVGGIGDQVEVNIAKNVSTSYASKLSKEEIISSALSRVNHNIVTDEISNSLILPNENDKGREMAEEKFLEIIQRAKKLSSSSSSSSNNNNNNNNNNSNNEITNAIKKSNSNNNNSSSSIPVVSDVAFNVINHSRIDNILNDLVSDIIYLAKNGNVATSLTNSTDNNSNQWIHGLQQEVKAQRNHIGQLQEQISSSLSVMRKQEMEINMLRGNNVRRAATSDQQRSNYYKELLILREQLYQQSKNPDIQQQDWGELFEYYNNLNGNNNSMNKELLNTTNSSNDYNSSSNNNNANNIHKLKMMLEKAKQGFETKIKEMKTSHGQEKRELSERIDELKGKAEYLQLELNDARQEINQIKEEAKTSLKEQQKMAQMEIEQQHELKSRAAAELINQLNEKLAEEKLIYETVISENTQEYEDKFKLLQNEKESLETELMTSKTALAEKETMMEEMKTAVAEIRAKHKELIKSVEENVEKKLMAQQLSDREFEILKQKGEINALEEMIAELEREKSAAKERIDVDKEAIAKLTSEISNLRFSMNSNDVAYNDMNRQFMNLNAKHDELKNEMKKMDELSRSNIKDRDKLLEQRWQEIDELHQLLEGLKLDLEAARVQVYDKEHQQDLNLLKHTSTKIVSNSSTLDAAIQTSMSVSAITDKISVATATDNNNKSNNNNKIENNAGGRSMALASKVYEHLAQLLLKLKSQMDNLNHDGVNTELQEREFKKVYGEFTKEIRSLLESENLRKLFDDINKSLIDWQSSIFQMASNATRLKRNMSTNTVAETPAAKKTAATSTAVTETIETGTETETETETEIRNKIEIETQTAISRQISMATNTIISETLMEMTQTEAKIAPTSIPVSVETETDADELRGSRIGIEESTSYNAFEIQQTSEITDSYTQTMIEGDHLYNLVADGKMREIPIEIDKSAEISKKKYDELQIRVDKLEGLLKKTVSNLRDQTILKQLVEEDKKLIGKVQDAKWQLMSKGMIIKDRIEKVKIESEASKMMDNRRKQTVFDRLHRRAEEQMNELKAKCEEIQNERVEHFERVLAAVHLLASPWDGIYNEDTSSKIKRFPKRNMNTRMLKLVEKAKNYTTVELLPFNELQLDQCLPPDTRRNKSANKNMNNTSNVHRVNLNLEVKEDQNNIIQYQPITNNNLSDLQNTGNHSPRSIFSSSDAKEFQKRFIDELISNVDDDLNRGRSTTPQSMSQLNQNRYSSSSSSSRSPSPSPSPQKPQSPISKPINEYFVQCYDLKQLESMHQQNLLQFGNNNSNFNTNGSSSSTPSPFPATTATTTTTVDKNQDTTTLNINDNNRNKRRSKLCYSAPMASSKPQRPQSARPASAGAVTQPNNNNSNSNNNNNNNNHDNSNNNNGRIYGIYGPSGSTLMSVGGGFNSPSPSSSTTTTHNNNRPSTAIPRLQSHQSMMMISGSNINTGKSNQLWLP